MRQRVAFVLVLFLLQPSLLAQVSDPLADGEALFEGLGSFPGGPHPLHSDAQAVSMDGLVIVGAGTYDTGTTGFQGVQAFRWEDGEMEEVGFIDPRADILYSRANAVSNDGSVIVGESSYDVDCGVVPFQAFRWENGAMQGLGFLDPAESCASAARNVSSDGSVVVGWSYNFIQQVREAFRWEDGAMAGLGDLEGGDERSDARGVSGDGAIVVGNSTSANGTEAFRWEDGVMAGLGSLGGNGCANFSIATDISTDGSIIVGQACSPDGPRAFRWENDEMQALGDWFPMATSADGTVIVGREWLSFDAVLWREGEGKRLLKEVLEDDHGLDLSDWQLELAYDVSDDGTVIVGRGLRAHVDHVDEEAWRAVIPHTIANETVPEALSNVLGAPHPNPATGSSTLKLEVEHAQHAVVEVFDVTGRRVQSVFDGGLGGGATKTLTIDASALPAGIYVVRATGEDFAEAQNVTVVH